MKSRSYNKAGWGIEQIQLKFESDIVKEHKVNHSECRRNGCEAGDLTKESNALSVVIPENIKMSLRR